MLLYMIDYISAKFYLRSMFLLRIHASNVPSNLLTTYNNKVDTGHYLFFSFLTTQGNSMAYFILVFLF